MEIKMKIISVTALILLTGSIIVAADGPKQVRLTNDRGVPIGDNQNPWLTDSILVQESPFTLDIVNHLPESSPKPNIDGIYLIIAANRDPRGVGGINVAIGPAEYSDLGTTIPAGITIPDSDWTQVSGNNGVDVFDYNTASHGVLTDGTWYTVQQIDPAGNNKYLLKGEVNHIFIGVSINSPNLNDRIHIDSVGTHLRSDEKGFTGNPYSSDLTWQMIPEYPTVALPVAAAIGLMFLFQHRKRKEE